MSNVDLQPRNGQGALFKNTRKAKPTDPDYTGLITVEGLEFRLSGWIKEDRNGGKYMKLSALPKPPPGRQSVTPTDDLNDQIPF